METGLTNSLRLKYNAEKLSLSRFVLLPVYLLLLSSFYVCVRLWCTLCVLFFACCLQFLQFCCACCFLFLFFLTTCWCCGCVWRFLSTSFTLCSSRVCVCKDTNCSTLARVPLKCAQGCWLVRKNVTCGLPKLLANPTGTEHRGGGWEGSRRGAPHCDSTTGSCLCRMADTCTSSRRQMTSKMAQGLSLELQLVVQWLRLWWWWCG